MRETEPLNPGVDPGIVLDVQDAIDWSKAPALAAAYIVVCVDQRVDGQDVDRHFGAWYIDTTHERIQAPSFGITSLARGQRVVVRRPGSRLNPVALETLRAKFWKITGLNDFLEILPPLPDYEPPSEIRVHPLHAGLLVSMEIMVFGSEQARRVQLQPHSGA